VDFDLDQVLASDSIAAEDTLRAILRKVNGPEGLAELIVDDIRALGPGNPQRAKYLISILTAQQKIGEAPSPSEATPEELKNLEALIRGGGACTD
jgi:hypothetical protein